MGERKSWASSLEAKQSHAIFECLTHNLLLLFEKHIGRSEGLCDEEESEKEEGRTKGPVGIIRTLGNFINTAVQRATQRTQRFIRWVRVWIYRQAPWSDSIDRLRQVWTGKTT
jgi:L,D-peptidoglycan transpeptidase YkuD (ErfK/YbiS/YcfS/YnhG family)